MPFCKYVFLGRTIQMLWGGGAEQGRHVPIALKSSPKSGQNMQKKCSNRARIFEKVLFPNRCS